MKSIAIIGIGLRIGPCETLHDFWQVLSQGIDCIGELPSGRRRDCMEMMPSEHVPPIFQAAFLPRIDTFDNELFQITDKEAELMDPRQRILLETAWEAMEDAGYPCPLVCGTNTGVFIGAADDPAYKLLIKNGPLPYHPAAVSGNLNAYLANRISQFYNITGPSIVYTTSCSSSMVALHAACNALRQKECDMALAGGVNVFITPWLDEPLGVESSDFRSKPFDESANGMGTGEGCIVLLLKTLDKAKLDKDPIYAVIRGEYVNHNGRTANITAPKYTGQANVIRQAWANAQVSPQDIQYIEMHGTGTKIGDAVEAMAVSQALCNHVCTQKIPVGSVKSNIGHLGSCAGLAGIVKCILQMQFKQLVPSIHFSNPNSTIDFKTAPFYVNTVTKSWPVNGASMICGVNSFGIGGTNAHAVIESYPSNLATQSLRKSNQFILSAQTMESLCLNIDRFLIHIKNHPDLSIEDICYTLTEKRQLFAYRFTTFCSTIDELTAILEDAILNGYRSELHRRYVFSFADDTQYEPSQGAELNYLNSHTMGNTIHLPTYCFQKKRHWATGTSTLKSVTHPLKGNAGTVDTEQISSELHRIFSEIFGRNDIPADKSFFDLGGDSFFSVKLLDDIRQQFDLTLSFQDIVQYPSLNELSIYIDKVIRLHRG